MFRRPERVRMEPASLPTAGKTSPLFPAVTFAVPTIAPVMARTTLTEIDVRMSPSARAIPPPPLRVPVDRASLMAAGSSNLRAGFQPRWQIAPVVRTNESRSFERQPNTGSNVPSKIASPVRLAISATTTVSGFSGPRRRLVASRASRRRRRRPAPAAPAPAANTTHLLRRDGVASRSPRP